jgi:hypothetical protein
VPFAGGGVFDFHVAGTDTVFHQCRYYFISTLTRDPSRIEALSIGTAPQKLTRAALEAANAAMRRQLKVEGWLAGHEEYKSADPALILTPPQIHSLRPPRATHTPTHAIRGAKETNPPPPSS